MDIIERCRGCLLGLAVGDAVGTTLEFQSPDPFAPITDMAGGGPFRLKPGEWTDDTSMALCLVVAGNKSPERLHYEVDGNLVVTAKFPQTSSRLDQHSKYWSTNLPEPSGESRQIYLARFLNHPIIDR